MVFFPQVSEIKVRQENDEGKIDFYFDGESHSLKDDGQLKTCKGIERLKNWILKVVLTQVNAYEVYFRDERDKFGVSIYEHIGEKPKGYWLAELEREITKQLTSNAEIDEVKNYRADVDRRKCVIEFDVVTVDGFEFSINSENRYFWNADTNESGNVVKPPIISEPLPTSNNGGVYIGNLIFGGFVDTNPIVGTAIIEEV